MDRSCRADRPPRRLHRRETALAEPRAAAADSSTAPGRTPSRARGALACRPAYALHFLVRLVPRQQRLI